MAIATESADREHDRLRSDAQHNRERILAVAREALSASGEASLNSIAKKAGIGPGTLYRHFPNREILVLAVYQEDVRALTESPADLLAEHPPIQALRLWFDRLAAYSTTNRSLAAALQSAVTDGLQSDTNRRVTAAAEELLSACKQDGSVAADIEPDDVLLLLGFLARIEPGHEPAARVARLLDVIMSGLQAGAPRSLARVRKRPVFPSLRRRRRLVLMSFSTSRSPIVPSGSPLPRADDHGR